MESWDEHDGGQSLRYEQLVLHDRGGGSPSSEVIGSDQGEQASCVARQ